MVLKSRTIRSRSWHGDSRIGPVNDELPLCEVPTALLTKEAIVITNSQGLALALTALLRELMNETIGLSPIA